MKFFIISTFVLLAFAARPGHSQDFSDCMAAAKNVLATFTTPEVEASVEAVLKEKLCGEGNAFPNAQECEKSISQRWPSITALLVETGDVFANQSCTQAIPIQLDWNCKTCQYRIQGLLNTLRSTAFLSFFRELANGPAYCEKGSPSQAEIETCQEWVANYIPKAFLVLRITPLEDICNELYDLCSGEIGCRTGMEQMIIQMGDESTIDRTKIILKDQVCSQSWVPGAEGCKRAVDLYWAKLAKTMSGMSPNFITICQNYNYFAAPSAGEKWNCETCQKRMREVMRFHLDFQIDWIVSAVSQINYSDFCKNLSAVEGDIVVCEQSVRTFIPRALQVLMDDANENPDKLCRNIFDFDNSCQFIEMSGSTSMKFSVMALLASGLFGLLA